jgi:hypothetical protein
MRTIIDIPDPIYRQLKAKAASQGCSVKELILRGIGSGLGGNPGKESVYRVKLPLIRSKKPGWLKLTNAQINEILFP